MKRYLVLVVGLAAAAACDGAQPVSQEPVTARLDDSGVNPQKLAVEGGALVQFMNDDVRAHEIYSNDCRELGSTLLAPGATFVTQLDAGPKVCHFQDLLAPSASEYWGTVEVTEPPVVPDPATGG
jgi:hypothetical protein